MKIYVSGPEKSAQNTGTTKMRYRWNAAQHTAIKTEVKRPPVFEQVRAYGKQENNKKGWYMQMPYDILPKRSNKALRYVLVIPTRK